MRNSLNTLPAITPQRACRCGCDIDSASALMCPACETYHATTEEIPSARAYRFDAQATRDALELLQRASIAANPVESIQRMTYSARARFNAEMRAYLGGQ
jgi:hypothetical protein